MEIERLKVGPLQTNCYVLIEDGKCIVIDAGGDQEKIIAFLEKRRITPQVILATHGHFDHILSVPEIKSRFGVPFLISKKDLEIVSGFEQFVEKYIGFDPGPAPIPDNYINMDLGNDIAQELKERAFLIRDKDITPHDIVEDKIFTGDFIFKGTIGRTDFGGSYKDMAASIEWAKRLDHDLKVFPGHGDPTTIENEKRNNPFFRGNIPAEK